MNTVLSLLGFLLGCVVLYRNLAIFKSDIKSPSVDTWLVFVGTLAWSLMLFADMYQRDSLSPEEVFARVLFFVFWCGQLLKIKRYCYVIRKRRLRFGK